MSLIFLILTYLFLFHDSIYKNFFVADELDYLSYLFFTKCSAFEFIKIFMMSPYGFIPLRGLLSYLCFKLSSLNPCGYIIISVILFSIFNIIVVYKLIEWLSKDKKLAFLTTFLFCIYLVQFTIFLPFSYSALSFFFFYLSILSYIASLKYPNKGLFLYAAALIFYAFSLLSKENCIILPLFILVYHIFFERSRNAIKTGGFFLITFLYLVIRFYVLGLWIAKQDNYHYNFFDVYNVIFSYKIFLKMTVEMLSDVFTLCNRYKIERLFSIPFYCYLVALIVVAVVVIKIGNNKNYISDFKKRLKLFSVGLFWYFIGLFSFVFINDKAHGNSWYLYLPSFGFLISLSILILEIYRLLSRTNFWFSKTILYFILLCFFLSTLLVVTGVTNSPHCNIIYESRNTKRIIEQINNLYPAFPDNSRIYLIGFLENSRIPAAISIFCNPTIKCTYLSEDKHIEISDDNTYVLKLIGNIDAMEGGVNVVDMTLIYRKKFNDPQN